MTSCRLSKRSLAQTLEHFQWAPTVRSWGFAKPSSSLSLYIYSIYYNHICCMQSVYIYIYMLNIYIYLHLIYIHHKMLVDCSCEPTYQSNVTNKSKLLLVKYHKNRRYGGEISGRGGARCFTSHARYGFWCLCIIEYSYHMEMCQYSKKQVCRSQIEETISK